MKPIYILNGPNLNLLGKRQPEIYGSTTLADIEVSCAAIAKEQGSSVKLMQSNYEGQIVDWIQEAREEASAIVINPAAYSHTSVAIHDALATFDGPIFEVHISNIHSRESFRHFSYVTSVADGMICGCGAEGYELATRRALSLLKAS